MTKAQLQELQALIPNYNEELKSTLEKALTLVDIHYRKEGLKTYHKAYWKTGATFLMELGSYLDKGYTFQPYKSKVHTGHYSIVFNKPTVMIDEEKAQAIAEAHNNYEHQVETARKGWVDTELQSLIEQEDKKDQSERKEAQDKKKAELLLKLFA
jgi:hypothetical protein